jgi:hypothetical protein
VQKFKESKEFEGKGVLEYGRTLAAKALGAEMMTGY